MARYAAPGRTTNAPTSTLPGASLYAIASVSLKVREIAVFNTVATACVVTLNRLTTAGTQGAAVTVGKIGDTDVVAASGTPFQSHTVAPTLGTELYRIDLAAAVGSGWAWTFDDEPLRIPAGTANGLGLIAVGTGTVLDFTFVWEE